MGNGQGTESVCPALNQSRFAAPRDFLHQILLALPAQERCGALAERRILEQTSQRIVPERSVRTGSILIQMAPGDTTVGRTPAWTPWRRFSHRRGT
jgi:hypothetical protein